MSKYIIQNAHMYLRKALNLSHNEPYRFDYYATLIDTYTSNVKNLFNSESLTLNELYTTLKKHINDLKLLSSSKHSTLPHIMSDLKKAFKQKDKKFYILMIIESINGEKYVYMEPFADKLQCWYDLNIKTNKKCILLEKIEITEAQYIEAVNIDYIKYEMKSLNQL